MAREALERIAGRSEAREVARLGVRIGHRGHRRSGQGLQVPEVLQTHHPRADDAVPQIRRHCPSVGTWTTSWTRERARWAVRAVGRPARVRLLALHPRARPRRRAPRSTPRSSAACTSSTPPTSTASTGAAPASACARRCSAGSSPTRPSCATGSCSRPRAASIHRCPTTRAPTTCGVRARRRCTASRSTRSTCTRCTGRISSPTPRWSRSTLLALRDEGKIRAIGISNHTPSQHDALRSFLGDALATTQPEYSAAHLGPLRDGTFDRCLRDHVTPLAWSPLAGGRIVSGEGIRPGARRDARRARRPRGRHPRRRGDRVHARPPVAARVDRRHAAPGAPPHDHRRRSACTSTALIATGSWSRPKAARCRDRSR